MSKKNIFILLGGTWHDFDGFAAAMKSLLEGAGYRVQITDDPDALTHLNELGCDLLLSYTCLTEPLVGETNKSPTKFSNAQIDSLTSWVRSGRALLAAHAATVVGASGPGLERLLGGAFIRHPPQFNFKAIPLPAQHPITEGIEAFDVYDELYIERYDSSVIIHMIAIYEQVAYPVVWSRREEQGRVAHIALGHSQQVWDHEPYQHLMLQTIQWLIKS